MFDPHIVSIMSIHFGILYDNDFILKSTQDKVVHAECFHFMRLTLKSNIKPHSDVKQYICLCMLMISCGYWHMIT